MLFSRSTPPPVFAVIDTETTGLSAKREHIIELGVALLDRKFRQVGTWSTLVNPLVPVRNHDLHGITDAMLVDAPRFAAIYTEFAEVCHGKVLIAHNARFDGNFLTCEDARVRREYGDNGRDVTMDLIDSIDIARSCTYKPYNLAALAKRYGIRQRGAHTAADDAAVTGQILRAMAGRQYRQASTEMLSAARPFCAEPVRELHLPRGAAVPR